MKRYFMEDMKDASSSNKLHKSKAKINKKRLYSTVSPRSNPYFDK